MRNENRDIDFNNDDVPLLLKQPYETQYERVHDTARNTDNRYHVWTQRIKEQHAFGDVTKSFEIYVQKVPLNHVYDVKQLHITNILYYQF